MGSSDHEKEAVVTFSSPEFEVEDHSQAQDGSRTQNVVNSNITHQPVVTSEGELKEQEHQPTVSGLSQDSPLPVTGKTFSVSRQELHRQGQTLPSLVLDSVSTSYDTHESLRWEEEEYANKISILASGNTTTAPPSQDSLKSRVYDTGPPGTTSRPATQTVPRTLTEANSSRQTSSVQQQPQLNLPPAQSPWVPFNSSNTSMPSCNLDYHPPDPWTTPPATVSGFSFFWPPTHPLWTQTQRQLYHLVHASVEDIDLIRTANHGAEILLPHPDILGFYGDTHQTQLHPVFNGALQLGMYPRQMVELLLGLFDHRIPLLEVPMELRHWIVEESGDQTRQWRMFAALLEARNYYRDSHRYG